MEIRNEAPADRAAVEAIWETDCVGLRDPRLADVERVLARMSAP